VSRDDFEPPWVFQRTAARIDELITHLINIRVDLDRACFGRDWKVLDATRKRVDAIYRAWHGRSEKDSTAQLMELIERIEKSAKAPFSVNGAPARDDDMMRQIRIVGAAHYATEVFPEHLIHRVAPAIQAVAALWLDGKNYRQRWKLIFEIATALDLAPQSPAAIERIWQSWKRRPRSISAERFSAQVVRPRWAKDAQLTREQMEQADLSEWVWESLWLLDSLVALWQKARKAAAPTHAPDAALTNLLMDWHFRRLLNLR
jgi:hypothetical protein